MEFFKKSLEFRTNGKGMIEISDEIEELIQSWNIQEGMCFLFLPHASASLTTSEAYDPSSRVDVENFYERIAPEGESWYKHTLEGSDDSPSHIRSTLTQDSLSIPIDDNRLSIGRWQGIFLFEHRSHPQTRNLFIRCLKIA